MQRKHLEGSPQVEAPERGALKGGLGFKGLGEGLKEPLGASYFLFNGSFNS